jgi:uncharacterized alpha-E superfamily protein
MISRVAAHCFWLGRYLERGESTSRVLRVTYGLALDAILPPAQVWGSAVTVSGEDAAFVARHGPEGRSDGEQVQQFLTWDVEVGSSLIRSVSATRANANGIREVVSLESWEAINELYLWLSSRRAKEEYLLHRDGFYRHVRSASQLILGAIAHTMLHDNAFDFIKLGVLLERVGQTARILDVHHHALMQLPSNLVREETLWLSLLRACAGFEPFMKRSAGQVTPAAVAAFLILEPRFPRSILFGLHEASVSLASIRSPTDPILPRLKSQARLQLLEGWLLDQSHQLDGGDLHALLTRVVEETATVCAELGSELLAVPEREAPESERPRPR